MRDITQDFRFALRTLALRPAFTLVAVITLALGMGANTAMFSLIDAILLRPLAYPHSDQLVLIWEHHPAIPFDEIPTSPPDFKDWHDSNRVFSDMALFTPTSMNLNGVGTPDRVSVVAGSGNIFSMLGVQPLSGRTFIAEDTNPDSPRVAVLSRGAAQRLFSSEAQAIGRDVRLNGLQYQIIGVMPANFEFPPSFSASGRTLVMRTDIWIPFTTKDLTADRGSKSLFAIARLKDGVSLRQAQANMDTINAALSRQFPGTNDGITVSVVPLHEQVVRNSRLGLITLFGAVGLVLLIACANVANLLLARASGRHKEIGIRMAVGGTIWRLIRQLLTESLALSALGSVAGLLLALWGIDFLVRFGLEDIPRLDQSRINGAVLAFTFVLTTLTGILFGLAPALQARRLDLNTALKESAATTTAGAKRQSLRNTLVVLETALAVILLIGSGLLIHSFARLQGIDPGFNADNLLTFNVALAPADYESASKQNAYYTRLIENVRQVSGVQAASISSAVPLTASMSASDVTAEGRVVPLPKEQAGVLTKTIGPGYFRTMGVPIREGREFTAADGEGSLSVAVVNETMAKRFWPGLNPIGRRVKIGDESDPNPWLTIVGIAADTRNWSLERPVESELYQAFAQSPATRMTIIARTNSDPALVIPFIRQKAAEVDPTQPIYAIQSMTQYVDRSLTPSRFRTYLTSVFAALATLLAAVGIYGVMSYFVSERFNEIGVRMALGAGTESVFKLVLREGMKLAAAGVAIGIVAALALARVLSTLLFGVSAADPLTFAVVAGMMMAVAAIAIYIPARRATRVDPIVALRYQ